MSLNNHLEVLFFLFLDFNVFSLAYAGFFFASMASSDWRLCFVHNVYCVNFMAQVVKLALCSLLMLIFMFVAVIAGSRFGMMYA